MNNAEIGNKGEAIACEYLTSKNYKIIATNYFLKTLTGKKIGEVDIIAKNKDVYIFIEVKSSLYVKNMDSFFCLERRVGKRKAGKIITVARNWISVNIKKPDSVKYQIDVIGVIIQDGNAKIIHLENTFEDKNFNN